MNKITIKLGMASKYTITIGEPITFTHKSVMLVGDMREVATAYAINMATTDAADECFNGVNKTHAIVIITQTGGKSKAFSFEVGKDIELGKAPTHAGKLRLYVDEFRPINVVGYRGKDALSRLASRTDNRLEYPAYKRKDAMKGKENGICKSSSCGCTENVRYRPKLKADYYCYHCAESIHRTGKSVHVFDAFTAGLFTSYKAVEDATGEIEKINEAPVEKSPRVKRDIIDPIMLDEYYD